MLSVDTILVARDFSPVSRRALRMGLGLAAKMRATLHVLHVYEDWKSDHPTRDLDDVQEELVQAGFTADRPLQSVSVRAAERQGTEVAPTILRYAEEEDVDLLVLGTRGRNGVKRVLVGSVAEAVIRRSDRAVLTVRERGDEITLGDIDRILVPVDFSERAVESTRVAVEWAELLDARTDLLHVVDEWSVPSKAARSRLLAFAKDSCGFDVSVDLHVERGGVGHTITEFANTQNTDLVVLSTHGGPGLKRSLLGSVTETVTRSVDCPVLTVRPSGRSIRAIRVD
jgi:nucleotide-binding universal stress UspA family protein